MPKELANTVYHYTGRNWMMNDFVGDKIVHTDANLQLDDDDKSLLKIVNGDYLFADKPWKTTIVSLDYSKQKDVEKYMYHDDAIKGHKKWIKILENNGLEKTE